MTPKPGVVASQKNSRSLPSGAFALATRASFSFSIVGISSSCCWAAYRIVRRTMLSGKQPGQQLRRIEEDMKRKKIGKKRNVCEALLWLTGKDGQRTRNSMKSLARSYSEDANTRRRS